MTFRTPSPVRVRVRRLAAIGTAALLGATALTITTPAAAAEAAATEVAAAAAQDEVAAPSTTTVVTPSTPATPAAASRFKASLRVDASIGAGTFVGGEQQSTLFATAWTPTLGYGLTDQISISGSIAASIYHAASSDLAFPDGRALLSDASVGVSHASIWKWSSEAAEAGDGVAERNALGLNLSGGLRVYLPTSEASMMQSRLFALRPTFTFASSWGPLSASVTTGLMKYFMTSSNPSIDCEEWSEAGECLTGRGSAPGGRFESERRGGEAFLPSSGVSSFYLMNGLSLGWEIVDGLSLGASATVFNIFGVRSFEVDDLSSEHARAGRSQTDRLVTDLGLTYRIVKQLSVGASLSTDTVQPFGADGDDFVWQGFVGRASDNISSLNFSVTGSL